MTEKCRERGFQMLFGQSTSAPVKADWALTSHKLYFGFNVHITSNTTTVIISNLNDFYLNNWPETIANSSRQIKEKHWGQHIYMQSRKWHLLRNNSNTVVVRVQVSLLFMHPLVLQQLVVLAELAQLRAKAAVLAAQRGELTPQLWLQLPVGLKIGLQALHVLLQTFKKWTEMAAGSLEGSHRKPQQRRQTEKGPLKQCVALPYESVRLAQLVVGDAVLHWVLLPLPRPLLLLLILTGWGTWRHAAIWRTVIPWGRVGNVTSTSAGIFVVLSRPPHFFFRSGVCVGICVCVFSSQVVIQSLCPDVVLYILCLL